MFNLISQFYKYFIRIDSMWDIIIDNNATVIFKIWTIKVFKRQNMQAYQCKYEFTCIYHYKKIN